MPAVRRSRLIELVWSVHRWMYEVSGGRLGSRLPGMLPVLLLTTLGRRSGRMRTHPLHYIAAEDAYVIIASNAGEARHPGWYYNLLTTPETTVQVGRTRERVRAREAVGMEREHLWNLVVDADSSYAVYQERTPRQIPVIVLERRA